VPQPRPSSAARWRPPPGEQLRSGPAWAQRPATPATNTPRPRPGGWRATRALLPVVLGGASVPLDLGRQERFYSEAQRTALAALYDECAAVGCDRPYAWSELHHEDPWSRGGHTNLDRAIPLCGHHHRLIHDAAVTATIRNGPQGVKTVTFRRDPGGLASDNEPRPRRPRRRCSRRGVGVPEVREQHRDRRQDGRGGVGLALAGDVGGRAVHRLEHRRGRAGRVDVADWRRARCRRRRPPRGR
jgi:hypothetical protein